MGSPPASRYKNTLDADLPEQAWAQRIGVWQPVVRQVGQEDGTVWHPRGIVWKSSE
jgi:hypothetical protein